ncbi:MAG: hypothetical protein JWM78_2801 [Verrucomicrobiaceae bacterium]|nr:hypothetical protein [Verrucomicrobiaceae bacterium]
MKKLWLSAVAATCLLAGSMAHAGDHWRGDHDGRDHRGWDRHDDRRYDGDRWRHSDWRGYRESYYRPAEVYYRPVRYYYPAPVYYERYGRRGYDNDIHGTISVGF